MSATPVLLGVLIVTAIVTCGVAIWALLETVKTARSLARLADDLDVRLVPLVEKADVTVDAINVELLRIDGIVTRFEEIGHRVDETTRTVSEVANAPAEIVTDLADKVRRAWRSRKQHGSQHDGEHSPEQDAASPADVEEV